MKINKEYITYVIVFFIAVFILILSFLSIYVCPFYYVTGVSCPSCGMSRAFLSVLSLDFKSSFHYHALWPLVVVVLPTYFLVKINIIKMNKKMINTLSIIVALIFLSYYIYRLITSSDIVEIHFYDSLIYKIYSLLFK